MFRQAQSYDIQDDECDLNGTADNMDKLGSSGGYDDTTKP